MNYETTLILPDAHTTPERNFERFKALSRYIITTQPDNIANLGDFGTYDSISAWNKNRKLTLEGQRFEAEIEAANKALDLIESEISKFNVVKSKGKKAQYRPFKLFIKGNHEDRIDRYLDENPQMQGLINHDKLLKLNERKWLAIDYKDDYYIHGTAFTHAPIHNGGQAISGKYVCAKALDLYSKSVIFGHTHRLQIDSRRSKGDNLRIAMTSGCFFDIDPQYAKGSPKEYWKGIHRIVHTNDGQFEIVDQISLDRLLKEYS